MNDNSKRGEQWKDLIAEYFVSRYGGIPDRWREANHCVVGLLVKKIEQLIETGINQDYIEFRAFEDELWINYIFDAVEVERPPKHEYSRICREVEEWVVPQIQADIEGIVKTIKEVRSEGYILHTASGETS